jgi:hypothetical protein
VGTLQLPGATSLTTGDAPANTILCAAYNTSGSAWNVTSVLPSVAYLNRGQTFTVPQNFGTPSALVLTNATGLPLGGTGVTGTLPVSHGGTGLTSFTANEPVAANGAGTMLTSWSSSTMAGYLNGGSLGTTGDIVGWGSAGLTDTGVVAANSVVASSPGAGIAHFAGSTQTVTSSPVSLTADVTGTLPVGNGGTGATSSTGTGSVVLATAPTISGLLTAAGLQSGGTTFTVSGCGTATSLSGGATVGTFKLGLGGTGCNVVITANGGTGLTANHLWVCFGFDITSKLLLEMDAAVSTTTCTLGVPAAAATGDVMVFGMLGG